ncbi:LysM peptidoglycan-binding domain-containing protein [Brotaphodocola sp.]|uniref:LysM peptidoglycan-binding domain-containing protein n=1 Tax=Brotaphodocola sp. TaxID=3073577 RepID=UPI003D7CBADF
MGECYNPYPKLPKNIRQIGERDPVLKLYVEDYVNTYLKRLYPAGGQDLRVGLLLGENREDDGVPYLFVDGALEMEGACVGGEKVEFSEELWKKAYRDMEQMFPRRIVLGWFLCGAPGAMLSPLNYWKQHGTYFSGKNQLMYVNSGLEGEEAVYTASEDGFYKLRGYSIYYEKNQMMQDYMVSRKDARRIESQTRDGVIRDFRKKMEEAQVKAGKRRSLTGTLGTACGVLSLIVLAGGVAMVNNYHKMQRMEAVIASVIPEGSSGDLTRILKGEIGSGKTAGNLSERIAGGTTSGITGEADREAGGEVEIERVPGEVYPTPAQIQLGDAKENQEGTDPSESPDTSGHPDQQTEQINSKMAAVTSESTGTDSQTEAGSIPVSIPSDAVSYVVQTGETLYGICMEKYHSLANMETICAWNQLGDGSHLSAGQKIYLPPQINP